MQYLQFSTDRAP